MGNNIEQVFETKKWFDARNSESRSGAGSTHAYTEKLRKDLPQIFTAFNVRTFLDAPCGDWNWMQLVDLSGINYIGLDIVGDIIRENQANHQRPGVLFGQSDITCDPLPNADLMMVRDCLFHLKYDLIWAFFDNFLQSHIPFLLTTSHIEAKNRDLRENGEYRKLDLQDPPFGFGPPIMRVDDTPDYGTFAKRDMCVWSRDQIASYLKGQNNG